MSNSHTLKIFIVDDDMFCRELYQKHLRNIGIDDISAFESGEECLKHLYIKPDVIFIDYNMIPYNGIELMKRIRAINPDIQLLLISGQKDIKVAVQALRNGAFDYIIKGDKDLEMITYATSRLRTIVKIIE